MPTPVIDKALTLDYASLSIEALQEELARLATVLDLTNAQRREIVQVIERRQADVSAQERVSTMTETQKDALRRVLNP